MTTMIESTEITKLYKKKLIKAFKNHIAINTAVKVLRESDIEPPLTTVKVYEIRHRLLQRSKHHRLAWDIMRALGITDMPQDERRFIK